MRSETRSTPSSRFRPLARLAVLAMAFAAGAAAAQVTVKDPRVRASIGASPSTGGYFEIVSAKGGRLLSAASPVAAQVELHEMKMDGDVMRMRAVEGGVPLPAGQPVPFRPHGLHVMFTGLKAPLKAGDSVPLTLVVEVRALVATQPPAAASTPAMGAASGHPMHGH